MIMFGSYFKRAKAHMWGSDMGIPLTLGHLNQGTLPPRGLYATQKNPLKERK
jgi:hypothetical protein